MIPPRIELGTFCVLGRCDNRYTTESHGLHFQRRTVFGVAVCPVKSPKMKLQKCYIL